MIRNEDNAMDSSEVRAELTQILAEHVGTSEASRAGLLLLARTAADAVLSKFALVKLPDMEVDQDGFETWPVEQKYDQGSRRFADGTVRIRKTDGRIDFTSVFTPFGIPESALSLAAALIASYRHVTQEK
jgi:hypothetical protein